MTLAFQALSGTIGAEVTGVDLARLSGDDFAAIRDAMLEHGVLVFRDQDLDPDQLHDFAARWGEIHLHPYLSGLPEHPGIIEIVKEAGRRALYISNTQTTRRIDGMTEAESKPLLDYLLAHATRPVFTCRIRWDVGSLAIWDNRRLLHMALDYYLDHRQVIHRITIKGEATVGVEAV
jgi:alpha-ketoglutarate-dependent taurine dioxygenase